MRWGVACGALMVLLSARHADAALIQVDFSTTIVGSPLGDVPFFGDFTYDDLGSGVCSVTGTGTPCDPGFFVPFLDLNLYFGAHHFTLVHASAPTPQVLLPLGSNGWGPSYDVAAPYLPAGVGSLGIAPGAAIFPYATFVTSPFFLTQCPSAACSFSLTELPPQTVPGPASLVLAVLGGGLFLARRGRRRA